MSDEIRSLTVVVTEDGSTGRVAAAGVGTGCGAGLVYVRFPAGRGREGWRKLDELAVSPDQTWPWSWEPGARGRTGNWAQVSDLKPGDVVRTGVIAKYDDRESVPPGDLMTVTSAGPAPVPGYWRVRQADGGPLCLRGDRAVPLSTWKESR